MIHSTIPRKLYHVDYVTNRCPASIRSFVNYTTNQYPTSIRAFVNYLTNRYPTNKIILLDSHSRIVSSWVLRSSSLVCRLRRTKTNEKLTNLLDPGVSGWSDETKVGSGSCIRQSQRHLEMRTDIHETSTRCTDENLKGLVKVELELSGKSSLFSNPMP